VTRVRRGANRASAAVMHSTLVAAWHMLQTGETYTDPGGDYYVRRDPERATKRFLAQLERLAHSLLAGGRVGRQREFSSDPAGAKSQSAGAS
jgi:hypothetical protein